MWEDWNLKNEVIDQGEGNHNRGRIEEELGKDLKKVAPPKFDGKAIEGGAKAWIIEMENILGFTTFQIKPRLLGQHINCLERKILGGTMRRLKGDFCKLGVFSQIF